MSERDYARKVVLQGKASSDTPVQDIMTRDVVGVGLAHTIPECMALMNQHGFRHLPVIDGGTVIGVLSVRDLLREGRVLAGVAMCNGRHCFLRRGLPGVTGSTGRRTGARQMPT
jgi:signal-transduction protein with cAMP-binding, CBS, and nucleotidyltransferase domain